jgi:hypothetical protein
MTASGASSCFSDVRSAMRPSPRGAAQLTRPLDVFQPSPVCHQMMRPGAISTARRPSGSSIGGVASSVLSADSRRRGRPKRPTGVSSSKTETAKACVGRRAAAHYSPATRHGAHSRQRRQAAGAAEPVSEDKRGVTVGAAHSQCPRPKGIIALPAFSEIKRPPN